MGTTKLKELKKQYEFVCNEYVTKFCNKQGMDFEGWYFFLYICVWKK